MQRAMGFLKQAAPFVARLLPLIDGNVVGAIGNLLSGRPHGAPPQVTVDLAPVKNQLSDLQAQQTELRSTMQEQTAGMKRVEDQLEMVREATDRNTLEQQELMEDLKSVGHKVNRIALGLSILLLASLIINLYLYYYIRKVLP
jgi:chromosome segregation ATPase